MPRDKMHCDNDIRRGHQSLPDKSFWIVARASFHADLPIAMKALRDGYKKGLMACEFNTEYRTHIISYPSNWKNCGSFHQTNNKEKLPNLRKESKNLKEAIGSAEQRSFEKASSREDAEV